MISPLDIDETVTRYGLDAVLKNRLISFDQFIWQDFEIKSVDNLIAYERQYQEFGKSIGVCVDSETEELSIVYMRDGEMRLLNKGAFQQTVNSRGEVHLKFVEAGLSDLEADVVITFLADISGLYRKDAYYYGIPPFINRLCEILNNGINKLPVYEGTVVRACTETDRANFNIGDVFTPSYCLTCSADLTWEDTCKNRYRIQTLGSQQTKARAFFYVFDNSEQQVSFLQNTSFRITRVNDWGEGKKEFLMSENETI